MENLSTIEQLVSKIPCPVCLNSRFEVVLDCESANSPCEIHAVCNHCHYRFVVTQDTHTMEELWPQVQTAVKEHACPICGDPDLKFEFLCDINSEDCFFLVRCARNNHFSRVDQKAIRYLF